MEQDIQDNKLSINSDIPDFELQGIDGQNHSPDDYDEDALVVIFTCNHCPYAKAYQERLYALQEDFSGKVQFIGINSNDAEGYPNDSFEEMKKRDAEFNFPYLRDDDQSVAEYFGAQLTPEAFVFDSNRKLKYHGRIDDNWKDADAADSHDLRDAIEAVLAGEEPEQPETPAIGCSIKWLG